MRKVLAAECARQDHRRPGIVALQTMIDRPADDHANARVLADPVELPDVEPDLSTVQTNIIRFK